MTINHQLGLHSNTQGSYGFLGIAQPSGADANTLKEVRNQWPAPTSCEDARAKYQSLQNAINENEGKISRGETDRVGKRYRIAYNVVFKELEDYIAGDGCKPKPAAETPVSTPTQTTTGNPATTSPISVNDPGTQAQLAATGAVAAGKNKKYLLYGGIGLVVLTVAGIIIYKKTH